MPELPEVEVTKQGIAPVIEGKTITDVVIYDGRLRWPVPIHLKNILFDQKVRLLRRRGKYILFEFDHGTMIIHLGMTGVLRIQDMTEPARKHDRVEFRFGKKVLRLHDPRKFGSIHWHPLSETPVDDIPMLKRLGVEPFGPSFEGALGAELLFKKSRSRTLSVKEFLLAGQCVVGVGNIYCSESLFTAGINPKTPAGKVSYKRYELLAESIRTTLEKAIQAGGSSLKDFVNSQGEPGHFMVQTKVYDRTGEPCYQCQSLVKQIKQGQRSTFYCSNCQK
jgi:formamidopyrimidine-DNA glycosylase